MNKRLLQLLSSAAIAGGCFFSASAQDIEGYFRVQNASGIDSEKGYVQVRGAFTAQPDQTFIQASTEAGSVMYIKAVPEMVNGKQAYRIENLRCQGIEVVGEPIHDYLTTLRDILNSSDDTSTKTAALWTLVRGGFEHGYTSIGRATLQAMIHIVAARLDEVGVSEAEELANFAERFNHEVADNINLSIYLEPVGEGYRLFYDVPDLQCVSDWYLKDENKATFEKGFESMRRYLLNKMGVSGEYLQPDEVAEMQAWGYDPTVKHHNYVDNPDGKFIYTPYEEIFADHELLFNWLKLNMIKFTDEDRCPKIELMGFYLPEFAKEMKQHALTKQLIGYFPRLRTNERCYLTDGKNNVFGHLDFTSAEGAEALGTASQWMLRPVTDADDAYLCFEPQAIYEGKAYAAVYTDFDMKVADPAKTILYDLSAATKTKIIKETEYEYFELVPKETAPAHTPVLIEMLTGNAADSRILPVAPTEEATPMGVMRKAAAMSSFSGVLLPTTISKESFLNMWNTNYDESKPVHTLTTLEGSTKALWMGQKSTGESLKANQAFISMPAHATKGYAIGEPKEDTSTGIDAIEASKQQADTVFDLQGRKVSKMTPGQIYILNGKKILAF